MSHTIVYNPELNAIELTVQGELIWTEVKQIFADAAPIIKDTGCFLFLSDYRQAKVALSTAQLYDLPKMMDEILSSQRVNVRQLKRALVVAGDLKDFQFFEAVTANASQRAKVFTDVDKAKKWLFEK